MAWYGSPNGFTFSTGFAMNGGRGGPGGAGRVAGPGGVGEGARVNDVTMQLFTMARFPVHLGPGQGGQGGTGRGTTGIGGAGGAGAPGKVVHKLVKIVLADVDKLAGLSDLHMPISDFCDQNQLDSHVASILVIAGYRRVSALLRLQEGTLEEIGCKPGEVAGIKGRLHPGYLRWAYATQKFQSSGREWSGTPMIHRMVQRPFIVAAAGNSNSERRLARSSILTAQPLLRRRQKP
uniref:Uncharacterized protein n=1 Tax=Mycena chlorophos TaxID=658473 RepID=A0ABQ0LTY0_MYCCL|nr:predicted protein [Mycena chlorophos]